MSKYKWDFLTNRNRINYDFLEVNDTQEQEKFLETGFIEKIVIPVLNDAKSEGLFEGDLQVEHDHRKTRINFKLKDIDDDFFDFHKYTLLFRYEEDHIKSIPIERVYLEHYNSGKAYSFDIDRIDYYPANDENKMMFYELLQDLLKGLWKRLENE